MHVGAVGCDPRAQAVVLSQAQMTVVTVPYAADTPEEPVALSEAPEVKCGQCSDVT